jgi:hypothetical protein
MMKTAAGIALGLLVLYAGGVLAFALLHYRADRPGAGRVLADFHGWLGLGDAPAPEPTAPPVPEVATPPPPAPEPPPPPAPVVPAPAPAPAEPAASQKDLDAAEALLGEAETGLKELRSLPRDGAFEEHRGRVLSKLGEAREILNRTLDAAPKSARGNKLWDRLQRLHGAARHM